MIKKTDKQKEAYEQAKKDTLKKYPDMIRFFKIIEKVFISGGETPSKSELKGDRIDDN